jgi:cell division protease FtsH
MPAPSSKLPQKPGQKPGQKIRFQWLYFLLAFWAVLIIQQFWEEQTQVTRIPYSQFMTELKAGNVTEVMISENYVRGYLKESVNGSKKEFMTVRVDPELADELATQNIQFSQLVESTFLRDLLSWTVPILFFLLLWVFLARRLQSGVSGGLMSVGKSKAKVYVETDTKTTFKDVAGVDEAKAELQEIVGFLKNPKAFGRLGARVPKGVLLVGPPGTGKTLLAKAVAGEASVPFFSISGSEFVEMFVGLGAARVRDLFEQARGQAPCIIFIDELDALGKSRHHPMAGGQDEKEQTLNQLLVEMDGFDSSVGVVLLGATNRPEVLDQALLRTGRFDRQVVVDRPDKKGRIEILKVHITSVRTDPDVDLEKVAALTPGFTGSDLANLVNEAAIAATRRGAESVHMGDFTQAMERLVAGLEKRSRILSPLEREIVAHHEMGHALVAASLPGADPVHKISIIPRTIGALGYTLQRPTGDRYLMTEAELRNKIRVLLGGRASEMLIFEHFSTGASDDLQKATAIARDMMMRFGMAPELGSVAFENRDFGFLGAGLDLSQRSYSEESARKIDEAVQKVVDESLEDTLMILSANRDLLVSSALELMQRETLEEEQLKRIIAQLKPVVFHKPPDPVHLMISRLGIPSVSH